MKNKQIIFLIATAVVMMSCVGVQFMTADDVKDLGYEITEDAVYSKAEINGFTITAKLSPTTRVHTDKISVLTGDFSEKGNFIVADVKKDKIVSSREDSRFKYETVRYKVILENGGLQLPCYYLQERAYYKVGSDVHLMPVPEISAKILEDIEVEKLADETIVDINHQVWSVKYKVQLKSGESEYMTTLSKNGNPYILTLKWKFDKKPCYDGAFYCFLLILRIFLKAVF